MEHEAIAQPHGLQEAEQQPYLDMRMSAGGPGVKEDEDDAKRARSNEDENVPPSLLLPKVVPERRDLTGMMSPVSEAPLRLRGEEIPIPDDEMTKHQRRNKYQYNAKTKRTRKFHSLLPKKPCLLPPSNFERRWPRPWPSKEAAGWMLEPGCQVV